MNEQAGETRPPLCVDCQLVMARGEMVEAQSGQRYEVYRCSRCGATEDAGIWDLRFKTGRCGDELLREARDSPHTAVRDVCQ